MRQVIYAINLTLDGCFAHTDLAMPDDEELDEFYIQLLRDAGLLVYGRKTYQLMVPYWPDIAKNQAETKKENEFALAFDSVKRVVFSKTLDSADGNTRLVRGNLQDEILKLKQEPGKNILVGGVDMPSQLIALGLVDEFRFVVHPVFAGKCTRLFEGTSLSQKIKLKLVDSKVFKKSGAVALHYSKQ
jgi:dihydrofolate reductase